MNFEEAHNQITVTSQDFLLMISAVAGILLFAFAIGKRGFIPPSKLNLRQGNDSLNSGNRASPKKQLVAIKRSKQSLEAQGFSPDYPHSRELNVVFNYNGHTFDAYEVFGLPAGSPLTEVTKSFEQALTKADPQSQEFLKIAYQAIRQNS